jgi:glucose/arabinose dehydrogenase
MRVSFLEQGTFPGLVLRATAALLLLLPGGAGAQSTLQPKVVASGLHRPVGFVQDPSDPTTQFIVQHDGRILVLKNGALQPAVFLDLSGSIFNVGERGLLGLAFPPDYGTTGRFYVSFSASDSGEGAGHTVVSRFYRAPHDPLIADPSSRFDLQWSVGERFIRQPFELHKAGHLAFGPDGYLYIATGDGGADPADAGDPLNKAQDLGSLLGKILRIDVAVGDADPNGFRVPAGNPFVTTPDAAPEIWSLGFRNPWKFSFDAATGAMLIADVGHDRFEEIDHEPAGQGGRNYGWHIREGMHDYDPSAPPAVLPLRDPVFEYDRATGRSITGGFVYRGQRLGAGHVGRYFFADFAVRRLYSIALSIDPSTGEAIASDLRDHTAALGGAEALGGISAFGVDAAGEIYVVSLTRGEILRLEARQSLLILDQVTAHPGLLEVSGWAIDTRAASGSGVDAIHLYAMPDPFGAGGPPIFLGASDGFLPRPDIGQIYGPQFGPSGFRILTNRWFPAGATLIVAYGRSTVSGLFEIVATMYFPALDGGQFVHSLDLKPGGIVGQPIAVSGWALDYQAATAPPGEGTGIRAVYVDILSPSGVLLRTVQAAYGLPRPDVGAIFGSRFQNTGFSATIHDLWPGEFTYRVRYVRTTGGEWSIPGASPFSVLPGPMIAIGAPAYGATVPSTFLIGGWAIDLRSSAGPGVDSLHIWAYPSPGSGTPPVFLGVADYGVFRPDVGAAFGAQFTNSGFNLVAGPLAPGAYDVVVFARTTLSGTFEIYGVVRVMVQ